MSNYSPFLAALARGVPLAPEGSNLVLVEWISSGTPPDQSPEWMAPLHIHHEDDEAWYILEGTLGFRIGETEIEAQANDAVVIPRGMVHTFWNPGASQARYLLMMTTQIHSLIEAIHHTNERDSETMKKLFKQYHSELVE